jgi:hypothetical protein
MPRLENPGYATNLRVSVLQQTLHSRPVRSSILGLTVQRPLEFDRKTQPALMSHIHINYVNFLFCNNTLLT